MSALRRTLPACHGHDDPDAERVRIKWLDQKSGEVLERTAAVGTTLLEAAHRQHIDLEGACEGSVACSTCHVIVSAESFGQLESADEAELDMIDLAYGVTDTSRLGCQLVLTADDIHVTIPDGVNNHF